MHNEVGTCREIIPTTQLVDNLNVVESNFQTVRNFDQRNRCVVKPGSHLCDKHEHKHKLKKNRV